MLIHSRPSAWKIGRRQKKAKALLAGPGPTTNRQHKGLTECPKRHQVDALPADKSTKTSSQGAGHCTRAKQCQPPRATPTTLPSSPHSIGVGHAAPKPAHSHTLAGAGRSLSSRASKASQCGAFVCVWCAPSRHAIVTGGVPVRFSRLEQQQVIDQASPDFTREALAGLVLRGTW